MLNEAKRLKEIIRLDTELSTVQDLDILLERILNEARKITDADAGTIYIRRGDNLVFSYTQNETQRRKLPPGQKLIFSTFIVKISKKSISGYVAATGEALNIPDVYKTTSVLTVPLKTNRDEIVGVLQIINKQDSGGEVVPFDSEDEVVVKHFAGTASMALQRAQLTRALILRMIQMAELRDPKETGPHVNRVASYATEIYERWAGRRSISPEELNRQRDVLRSAAMLHDVGKVGISDAILKKPGKLTTHERTIMETHTYIGARLFLNKQSEFDEVASMVALTHHENWDGTGYPGYVDISTGLPTKRGRRRKRIGMKKEEIPIFGRVVAIADVYDALQSKRAYKEAWDEDEVYTEIRRLSGKKFDPEIVDVFFDCSKVLKSIFNRYPDAD
jgi:response regulator RpfG family c-di-GMP phosphodiesterase